jgi:DNA-binding MarR family transcriptional regulator
LYKYPDNIKGQFMDTEGILGGSVGYQMKRAQHALRLEMDGALRGIGLTTPQYAALSVLEDEAGLSGAALARRCFVTPQTMNQILTNLQGSGMVERRPHPEHGRVLSAYLTRKGAELVARAHGEVGAIEERMLAGLNREERSRLLEALWSCAESLTTGWAGRKPGESAVRKA